jgi:hypothetical protein
MMTVAAEATLCAGEEKRGIHNITADQNPPQRRRRKASSFRCSAVDKESSLSNINNKNAGVEVYTINSFCAYI